MAQRDGMTICHEMLGLVKAPGAAGQNNPFGSLTTGLPHTTVLRLSSLTFPNLSWPGLTRPSIFQAARWMAGSEAGHDMG